MSAEPVTSWGRYPDHPQTAHPVFWRSELAEGFRALHAEHGTILPYGQGRSYGDSCMAASDHVLSLRGLNRFLSADWGRGVIHAEAGVTLSEILALSIPHGWFLPVTPGTQYVTLGGAIANDVHGKNHHIRGTFGRHVTQFSLLRSDRGELLCTPKQNPDLFRATLGGLGLTGIIASAQIQLLPIRSSLIDAHYTRFTSIDEFLTLSAEADKTHEYTVAWIDCLATGAKAGRGVLISGDHSAERALDPHIPRPRPMPFTPPFPLITQRSMRLFNEAYYRFPRPATRTVSYQPFFYPLDRVQHSNRIYGPRGLQQYQCVIPDDAARATLPQLLTEIAESGRGTFLAVLKRCGKLASPGLLSFPMPGVSLALDFAQHETLTESLFPVLDAMVRDAGGRLYPAKDAHMTGSDFRAAYPQWEQLEQLRDPALLSRFWQRVTL